MGKRKTFIEAVKEFKANVSKDLPLKKVVLFGSRAKDINSKWSDVDLLIVSDKFKKMKFRERELQRCMNIGMKIWI